MNDRLAELLLLWQDGTLSPEELAEMETLLAQPDARRQLVEEFHMTSAMAGILAAEGERAQKTAESGLRQKRLSPRNKALRHPARPRFWSGWTAIAATVLLAVGVGLAYAYWQRKPDDVAVSPVQPQESPAPATSNTPLASATVVEPMGDVTIERDGKRTPLAKDLPLLARDRLIVGAGASVEFVYADLTRIKAAAETSLTLQPGDAGADSGKKVFVEKGLVEASVSKQPPDKPMQFVTASASAKVLGTRLELRVSEQSTQLVVLEGRVQLSALKGTASVVVAANQTATVRDARVTFSSARANMPAETVVYPPQPTSGPGSSDYAHKAVTKSIFGAGYTQYWIFEPNDPKPATAPVIVFMHGWMATTPESYGSWIEHLVRRGNIVIYPRYQESLLTLPEKFTPSAIAALKEALLELKKDTHAKPDLARVATVGHSFGGVIAANLAALASTQGLPVFKAVVCVEPGTGGFDAKVYQDYSLIPAKTLLLCIAGADDDITHDIDAKRIFKEATNVAKDDKDYIVVCSDRYGKPPLLADHFAPVALANNAHPLRWYGFWKWLDAATDAAFFGKNRAYALGNTPEQRFMGKWSDGQAIVEPVITKEP